MAKLVFSRDGRFGLGGGGYPAPPNTSLGGGGRGLPHTPCPPSGASPGPGQGLYGGMWMRVTPNKSFVPPHVSGGWTRTGKRGSRAKARAGKAKAKAGMANAEAQAGATGGVQHSQVRLGGFRAAQAHFGPGHRVPRLLPSIACFFFCVCSGGRRVQQPLKGSTIMSAHGHWVSKHVQPPSWDLQLHTGAVCPQEGQGDSERVRLPGAPGIQMDVPAVFVMRQQRRRASCPVPGRGRRRSGTRNGRWGGTRHSLRLVWCFSDHQEGKGAVATPPTCEAPPSAS